MRKPRLSVAMVAKNAARTYKPLFSSLREFVKRGGDCVLVDTGSTDSTPTIYRAFGFRVYEVGDKFQIKVPDDIREKVNAEAVALGDPPIIDEGATLFHFANARNYAASLAENDWIMNPDADEAFTTLDIDAVEDAFGVAGRFQYDFVFSHNADGTPHLSFVTDTRLSNRLDWRWKGAVHETNEPLHDKAKMIYLPPHVLKLEHWQVESPTRSNYLAGLAYACNVEPWNDRNSHYYGRELLNRGWYRSAIKELERHLKLSNWDTEKSQSMCFIGDAYRSLGDETLALEWWHKAIDLAPRREPWMRIAQFYHGKDKPAKALPYVIGAMEIADDHFYGHVPEYYTTLPYRLAYWAYWWTGNRAKAKDYWQAGIGLYPDYQVFKDDACFFQEN